ncbi:MAG: T9SS type A sorting domain-containing protein [Candidatus Delongbacteria bacterium]|nr:T9SS type A sorting domain-containing protein [Candidatus Delongbacteria bacterium]
MKKKVWLGLVLVWVWISLSHSATYVVTNTEDDGWDGSFRWALQSASDNPGEDTVNFQIPIADPGFNGLYWTISVNSQLPMIDNSYTLIDGLSQSISVGEFNDGPEIMLDGRAAGAGVIGLHIVSSFNLVSSLSICGFSTSAITMEGSAAFENIVHSCHIGITPEGAAVIPNYVGIIIDHGANMNSIGLDLEYGRNCISGNEVHGLDIYQAHSNRIVNNYVGVAPDGITAVPNGEHGIWITCGSTYNRVGDGTEAGMNLVSGNAGYGIQIDGINTWYNRVLRNLIGPDVTGINQVGTQAGGVRISGMACHNRIDQMNIISGNGYGMIINGNGTDSNTVEGNWIGLDFTGMDTLSNLCHGLRIEDGARYNRVIGNVVSGNGWSGIGTVGDSTAYNEFVMNRCGTDPSGTIDLGNGYYGAHFSGVANRFIQNWFSGNRCGMVISNYSKDNLVLENFFVPVPGSQFPIANDEAGIRVMNLALNDTLFGNTIMNNGSYGIELIGDSVSGIAMIQNSITSNDSGGIILKSGANHDMQPPVIQNVSLQPPVVEGFAHPGSRWIEIFEDDAGQGKTYLGTTESDPNGHWIWEGSFTGPCLTATAMDTLGNSSPFSTPFLLTDLSESTGPRSGEFNLYPNYPNPFNLATTIDYQLSQPDRVMMDILDLTGRLRIRLIDDRVNAGHHTITWNGLDQTGNPLPSGIYLCRLKAGNRIRLLKLTLLK